ncbi:hypothetical protein MPSEU_000871800 [Mayamaea pseudoterrestris]|nr:hypothetical protein MPSEU_000871800 [Mayamaea pseudoterrestris]
MRQTNQHLDASDAIGERQCLLPTAAVTLTETEPRGSPRKTTAIAGAAAAVVALFASLALLQTRCSRHTQANGTSFQSVTATKQASTDWRRFFDNDVYDDSPIEVMTTTTIEDKHDKTSSFSSSIPLEGSTNRKYWKPPSASKRCSHVIDVFMQRAEAFGVPRSVLVEEYNIQSQDYSVFYRATAQLFWLDFAGGKWSNFTLSSIGIQPKMDGIPFSEKSLYTWITGDQHLSNFGAWKNRGGEVVFGVNDFDEAAIYDFHIDVIRIAVSIYNHAYTNGFKPNAIKNIVYAFLGTYVAKVFSYVGNDVALVSEITPKTSQGSLRDFLKHVESVNSQYKQLDKYTEMNNSTMERRLVKKEAMKLEKIDSDLEERIKQTFTSDQYGATMQKMGFRVREWDDDYYKVVDVARRVGSGVGSYGVDRYYVLMNGTDGTPGGSAVILDVKFEPWGAVSRVLSKADAAWYDVMFPHAAARAVKAQRALTSFTDPFTGWVVIDDRAFVVRQRSPWKASPDLDAITDKEDFTMFAEQVAIATATSHVRGSVSKSPAQFKHVLYAALEEYRHRKAWRKAITQLAMNYHDQVMLDYKCFKKYVKENFAS